MDRQRHTGLAGEDDGPVGQAAVAVLRVEDLAALVQNDAAVRNRRLTLVEAQRADVPPVLLLEGAVHQLDQLVVVDSAHGYPLYTTRGRCSYIGELLFLL